MQTRVSYNTLILFVNNAGGAALAFLISVVIGRTLGQSGLGQYAFAIAWITPPTMLADFGLSTLITRDAARDKSAARALLHTANRLLPVLAGLVLLLTWGSVAVADLPGSTATAIALAALLIALDPWYGLYTAAFRAFERMIPIFVVNVGGLVVQLALTWIAVRNGLGVIGAVGALIIVNVGQLAVIWLWWRLTQVSRLQIGRGKPRPYTNVDFVGARLASPAVQSDSPSRWYISDKPLGLGQMRNLLRRALPFAIAAVIGALAVRLNVLLLDRLSGDAATGQYSAASRFVEAGRLLPNAAFGALFPALAAASSVREQIDRLFRRAIVILGSLSLILALGLAVGASLLLRLSYGESFIGAGPTLALLGVSLIPSTLRGLVSLYCYSIGRERLVNRVGLIALAVQAGIGLVAITAYGAVGAAITTVLTESAALVLLLLFVPGVNRKTEAAEQ